MSCGFVGEETNSNFTHAVLVLIEPKMITDTSYGPNHNAMLCQPRSRYKLKGEATFSFYHPRIESISHFWGYF